MSAGDLSEFLAARRDLLVLTGAGVSTGSGIPDYRDEAGRWKRRPPINLRDFVAYESARRRYWARSFLGWPSFEAAEPNAAHRALSRLEELGRLHLLVTQNVDRLHQRAGSRAVLDLHGTLSTTVCLSCDDRMSRDEFQEELRRANPGFVATASAAAPDGDADLAGADYDSFDVPGCRACGGIRKPDVVFFGESVPRPRVEAAYRAVSRADGVLVVGSSLQVWSGYRFVKAAHDRGISIAIVNAGATRADELARVLVRARCEESLPPAVEALKTA